MFDFTKLINYIKSQETPHVSSYHRESYYEHCMLVISEMISKTDNPTLLIAACLHDIAKPRTQKLNKKGEPCFYGHENVKDEEIAEFLSLDDPRFMYVKALVLCHMVPFNAATAADYKGALVKQCEKALKKAAIDVEVNDDFIKDIEMLHEADLAASIKSDDELAGIEERYNKVFSYQLR